MLPRHGRFVGWILFHPSLSARYNASIEETSASTPIGSACSVRTHKSHLQAVLSKKPPDG